MLPLIDTVVRLGRVTGVEMSAERSRQAHRAARVPQVGQSVRRRGVAADRRAYPARNGSSMAA
jgi:hypothetical protein